MIAFVSRAALAALVACASGQLAQAQSFTCAIQPDGKSVRATVSNPHEHEAHCTTHCEFSTTKAGTKFMVECGTAVAASAVDFELCLKSFDEGRLVKMTSGKGDCLSNEVKEDKEEEDAETMMQRMQKQGQDFLDVMKKKQRPQASKDEPAEIRQILAVALRGPPRKDDGGRLRVADKDRKNAIAAGKGKS
jgi:hypothetical protein